VKDVKSGEMLTLDNLRAIRPGLGLPTKPLEQLLGKRVVRDVRRGTAAAWDLLS
jgi:sialic acid synthase SpsE